MLSDIFRKSPNKSHANNLWYHSITFPSPSQHHLQKMIQKMKYWKYIIQVPWWLETLYIFATVWHILSMCWGTAPSTYYCTLLSLLCERSLCFKQRLPFVCVAFINKALHALTRHMRSPLYWSKTSSLISFSNIECIYAFRFAQISCIQIIGIRNSWFGCQQITVQAIYIYVSC